MARTEKEHGRNSESRKCPARDRGGLLSIALARMPGTRLVWDMHTSQSATQWWRVRLQVQETLVLSLGGEDPWRRRWQATPVFLPGKSHGQRSLVGYSDGVAKSRTQLSN